MAQPFPNSADRVLLMDGAMATELQRAGVQPGESFELWNLTHPERVRSIHRSYVEAGAQVLLTNTFQANPVRLQKLGLLDQGAAICQAAVTLARSALDDGPQAECHTRSARSINGWVLGDVGPMADEPGGASFPRPEPLWQMAQWLSGADAILLETCSDWSAWQAIGWLRERLDLPILLSLTFRLDQTGAIRTWDRHAPEDFALQAGDSGLAGLGVNCGAGQDMRHIAEVLQCWRRLTDVPLFARPNAGTPVQVAGQWIYPAGPEDMAARLPDLLATGVRMLGGCCGTTPAHIAAFQRAITAAPWRES